MDDKSNSTSLSNNLVKNLNISSSSIFTSKLIIALIVVIILGVGTGYVFRKKESINNTGVVKESVSTSLESREVVGSSDTKTFKDTATGNLKVGGIGGEGAYHLVRPGGDSQNVYLTSSIVDLSIYVGKKVTVWGQTQKAQTAGWLMDVGRVEVLE
ncbi:MAG: hypothetical protein AAB600_01240 [Patescibacteria group bacterium]